MKNSSHTFWHLFLIILLFSIDLETSAQPLWLSNVPPANQRKSVSFYGMHRLCTVKEKRGGGGPIQAIQWVREGASVEHARYLSFTDTAGYRTFVFSPTRKRVKSQVLSIFGKSVVEYVDNEEGYYNVYLVMRKVLGDTLHVDVAKAELLSHSCRNGHRNVRRAVRPKVYPEDIPFEIVRERRLNENFHFFIASGDRFTYKPLLYGRFVPGIPITMCTEKGWYKKGKTNKKGEVEFQFIQDYFTRWSEINGRTIYYYMVFSEFTTEKSGKLHGRVYRYVHYSTSLSDGYFPSQTMYLSLVWGLIVFVVALVVIVAGIIIYRERRKKPYKEYTFDESEN